MAVNNPVAILAAVLPVTWCHTSLGPRLFLAGRVTGHAGGSSTGAEVGQAEWEGGVVTIWGIRDSEILGQLDTRSTSGTWCFTRTSCVVTGRVSRGANGAATGAGLVNTQGEGGRGTVWTGTGR